MEMPSVQTKIKEEIGYSLEEMSELPVYSQKRQAEDLLADKPWLAAYGRLYSVQEAVSKMHLGTIQKFLVRPKQTRDMAKDPREDVTVVDNKYGTTDMDPLGIIHHLYNARAKHCLEHLSKHKKLVDSVLETEYGFQPKTKPQLIEMVQVMDDDQTWL